MGFRLIVQDAKKKKMWKMDVESYANVQEARDSVSLLYRQGIAAKIVAESHIMADKKQNWRKGIVPML